MRSLLKELARMAGKIALDHFRHTGMATYTSKGRNDYVTHVDRRVEDAVVSRIRANHPDHRILAEEGSADRGAAIIGPSWIIDPIDGTTNFIRGIPGWAISICFCDDHARPRMGVIYDPVRDEMFLGERHAGVTLNGERVEVSGCTRLSDALIAQALPFKNLGPLDEIIAIFRSLQPQCNDMRRSGSAALDLAYTAVGRYDAYWELGIHPWDIAAGALMVDCAGGVATDLRGATNDLPRQRSMVAAASAPLHAALMHEVGALAHWLDRPPYTGYDPDASAGS
ncbi:MAG: inositol monophosphatase family protein [Planctomycetota bacterium]